METRQRRVKTSIKARVEKNKVRKSSKCRKRKSGDEQNDKSSSKVDSSKQRRIHFHHNNSGMEMQGPASTSKLEKRVSKSKGKQPSLGIENSETNSVKSVNLQRKNIQQKSRFLAAKTKKVARCSHKKTKNSQEKVEKNVKSKLQINDPDAGKRGTVGKLRNQRKMAKANKQSLPKGQKLTKNIKNSKESEVYTSAPRAFSDLFLTNLDIKFNLKSSLGSIHGISISDGNIWVNYLSMKQVKMLSSSGEILRCFSLDHCQPVLNCSLPSGELLVTQGYAGDSKPIISSISPEGTVKIFADLSSYAKHLFGILCKDEKIYVIGCNTLEGNHFVLRLNLIGEVEHVYNSNLPNENIKGLISLNGQVVGLRVKNSQMVALEKDGISSTVLNKVFNRNMYAASASVDNHGNVIIGTGTKLTFINPSLEKSHEISTGFSSNIIATAVDNQDQLWIGTVDGELFAAKYLL